MSKKHVLLIGGGGYVGSPLSHFLLGKNYKVTVLDDFVYEHQFASQALLNAEGFTLLKGDMGDEKMLRKASQGVTDVVILAGLVGDPVTKSFPAESEKINEKAVRSCIDFFSSSSISKLVFISTCSNYGLIGENELADEEFALNPLSAYARAKVENEKYLLSKKGKVNYDGVVLRFATAFGLSSRMRFDLTVNEFARDLYFGKELLVFDEHTWRPYCHVQDFARLIDLVLHASSEKVAFQVFNAGGDMNNFTKKMIVDAIVEHIPKAVVRYGSNGSDPRNYKVSFNKVKTVLGFEPQHSVKDGIRELIDAMEMGFFNDSVYNKDRYGNYRVVYNR